MNGHRLGKGSPLASTRSTRGYTISEMSIVIVVMGILSLIAVPVYNGIRASSLETAAMHDARLINAARDAFALTIPGAASKWNAVAADTDRLQLLIAENLLAGSPVDYLTMSGNYAIQLSGDVRSRTVLMEDGRAIDY